MCLANLLESGLYIEMINEINKREINKGLVEICVALTGKNNMHTHTQMQSWMKMTVAVGPSFSPAEERIKLTYGEGCFVLLLAPSCSHRTVIM